jgi:hypothetical protein
MLTKRDKNKNGESKGVVEKVREIERGRESMCGLESKKKKKRCAEKNNVDDGNNWSKEVRIKTLKNDGGKVVRISSSVKTCHGRARARVSEG